MAQVRRLRRHAGRGALLPLSPRRPPGPRAVAPREADPRLGRRLRVHRPPDEPPDRPVPGQRGARPVRPRAGQGGAQVRRRGREAAVSRRGVPTDAQRAVPQGLHSHREPGRGDRRAGAAERAADPRARPVEVQRRGGRLRPRGGVRGGMEDLADRSAAALVRLVAAREVSPVEVVQACLARLERYNPALNAVVTRNEQVLDEARALERRLAAGDDPPPLCGLPLGIHDVTPVAGLRTTCGPTLYRDYVPPEDALVVRRLPPAGPLILGKTNSPEFAAGGNTFNHVLSRHRNPLGP